MHGIEEKGANGQASVMLGSGTPGWHKLGTVIQGLATAEETIVKANLGFKVEKSLNHIFVNGEWKANEGSFGTYRTDTGYPLGSVGASYTPLQNVDAFKFFDTLIGEGEAIYESAGVLHGGRKVWIMAKLPKGEIVLKGNDVIEQYCLLTNSHNGTSGVVACLTNVRVVCANTLHMALKGTQNRISIRHTTNVQQNVAKAHELLGLRNVGQEALKEAYELLANRNIRTKFVTNFLDTMYPKKEETKVKTNGDRIRTQILEAFETSPGANFASSKGTAFGLYNAVTYVTNHVKEYKNDDQKMNSIWFGDSARKDAVALNTLLKMSKN